MKTSFTTLSRNSLPFVIYQRHQWKPRGVFCFWCKISYQQSNLIQQKYRHLSLTKNWESNFEWREPLFSNKICKKKKFLSFWNVVVIHLEKLSKGFFQFFNCDYYQFSLSDKFFFLNTKDSLLSIFSYLVSSHSP